mgnify:CR=1 FL=1
MAWTEVLTASAWTVHVPHSTDPAAVSSAVDALLASPTWVAQRMTKSGLRDFDVRGALIGLGADGDLVRMMIRHQTPLMTSWERWNRRSTVLIVRSVCSHGCIRDASGCSRTARRTNEG